MPSQLAQFGYQAAGGAVGGLLGLAFAGANDKRQLQQQAELNTLDIAKHNSIAEADYKRMLQMWKDTNYSAQIEQMKKAGLNPALLYGMGGTGGATTGGGSGGGGATHAPVGGGEIQAMTQMGIQLGLMQAQKENIEAQTEKTKAETIKTSGVDTQNVQADTENKILQAVISKYTGMEAKDVYERVKAPNRGIEAKTYQDELEARQGVAGTIYELWLEGKLKEKSLAEIEAIALSNAKTREEKAKILKEMDLLEQNIKGAEMDNVIKDLEMRLQTETGIDKNSSGFLKILGRLFLQLTKPK